MSALKILAIPGSLRPTSSSNIILKHALQLFPKHVHATVYNGIGNLPHFNDSNDVAESVSSFRNEIQGADGVLICQPEYAFGVAGSLKNALDWTVGSGDFVNKPVALITAATGGENAHAAMKLTLTAMNSIIKEEASLLIPFVKAKLNTDGSIKDPLIMKQLKDVVNGFVRLIESGK